ncbi:signal recognition particle 68 [Moniliophthora roreri]|uniref:Signal recognition particle subunit SRP68 n=1 Tax=Moniliophthora roreri TaxID=221103 RepID=A0A0W0F9S6_MONRR|nr:signal recognition particle 68 [Moniliophthora roreri]
MGYTVNFRALLIANEQRSAYGLRYSDFARYRKHCGNRTHRLRSTVKLTHGKGRDFKKLPPLNPETIKDGHLQLLLFEAERAWSYSQELTSQSIQSANADKASSIRHHATGRFRRSVHWATQLLSHCQTLYKSSRLSAENLLEVTIYTLILNGRFLRYRDDFEDALIQLCVARSLLDELANAAPTSRDQALATFFSDEVGPEIRYCAHELGRSKAYDVDSIVNELSAEHRNGFVEGCESILQKFKQEVSSGKEETSQKLETLMWEGEPVPVRNPELVDVLLKVQQAEKKLKTQQGSLDGKGGQTSAAGSKKSVAAYDAILLALSDAEDVARKLSEVQQSGTQDSTAISGSRDLHFVHNFVTYHLLSYRIQRDLLLVLALISQANPSKKSSQTLKGKAPQVDTRLFPAIVKLLDTILQSLDQMRALNIVDDSPDLASAIEARISYTKARRCLELSRCYVSLKKYAEALALLQHFNIHIRETNSLVSLSSTDVISSQKPSFYHLTAEDINDLESEAASESFRFKREWFTCNGGSVNGDPKSYKKPLFFNIALNYVDLNMDGLQERAGKQPEIAQQTPIPAAVATPKPETTVAKKSVQIEDSRPSTPEPNAALGRGGLSSLLGGWWGRS